MMIDIATCSHIPWPTMTCGGVTLGSANFTSALILTRSLIVVLIVVPTVVLVVAAVLEARSFLLNPVTVLSTEVGRTVGRVFISALCVVATSTSAGSPSASNIIPWAITWFHLRSPPWVWLAYTTQKSSNWNKKDYLSLPRKTSPRSPNSSRSWIETWRDLFSRYSRFGYLGESLTLKPLFLTWRHQQRLQP